MPQVEDDVTLSCVSNEVGGNLVGNARWQGVPLGRLLERAGVQPERRRSSGARSTTSRPASRPQAIDGRDGAGRVGDERRAAAGQPRFPRPPRRARAVRLRVGDQVAAGDRARPRSRASTGTGCREAGPSEAPIKTQSRIDVPAKWCRLRGRPSADRRRRLGPDSRHRPGRGAGRRRRVAGGHLGDAASGDTWVQWWLDWDATPGEHRIQVRATTTGGETQTDERVPPAPNGAHRLAPSHRPRASERGGCTVRRVPGGPG